MSLSLTPLWKAYANTLLSDTSVSQGVANKPKMIDIPEKSYIAKTDQNEHKFIQSKSPNITACTKTVKDVFNCMF